MAPLPIAFSGDWQCHDVIYMPVRFTVNQGLHEFWIMIAAYIGFASVILWRRVATSP
jgi:hypothetical protein